MFGDIFNSIPVVGHLKGLVHYATGDPRAGNKSMYEASRSSAVLCGGAVGALGGPIGMAAGAAAAGAATDTLAFLVTLEPKGIIAGVSNIATDISNGEVPIKSVGLTGLTVLTDTVGGFTGTCVSNIATKAITKSTAKSIITKVTAGGIETVTKTALVYGATRKLITENEEHQNFDRKFNSSAGDGRKPSTTNKKTGESEKASGTSGSGGEPPNNNEKNNKKVHYEEQTETNWETFLRIFKVEVLEDIEINGKYIFRKINAWQKKELKDFVVNVKKRYKHLSLNKIVNLAVKILAELGEDQVTCHDFVNIAKFVLAYLCEELTEENEAVRDPTKNFSARIAEHADIISSNDSHIITNTFRNLMIEIANLSAGVDPQFVNASAGVYHYFKHKFIKHMNILLTPAEYFHFASTWLNKLKVLPQFKRLKEAGAKRIVYEIYNATIGRRLLIVIKFQGGKWNLSSCYFTDNIYEGDNDGDEWINNEKIQRQ